MARPLTDFLPFTLPWARGASEIAATAAILRAAIQFANRSQFWRLWLDNQSIVAADAPVATLTGLPDDSEILSIHGVHVNSNTSGTPGCDDWHPLLPDTADTRRSLGITDESTDSCMPKIYGGVIDDDGLEQLNLLPATSTDYPGVMRVYVWLRPTQTAATLPEWMYTRYPQGIGNLAAAILHGSSEEWAEPARVKEYQTYADADIHAANHWAQSHGVTDSRHTRAVYR